MRLATFALAAALLAAGAAAYTQPAYPINKTSAATVKMTNQFIMTGTLSGFASLPGKLGRGEFVVNAPGAATPKTEVRAAGARQA